MRRSFEGWQFLFACLWVLVAGSVVLAEEKPKVIEASEARNNIGRKCVVTFVVEASKHSVKRKTVYLDSEKDINDPDDLGIQLDEEAQAALKARSIEDPATHFRGRRIRVTGEVFKQEGRVYIRISGDLSKLEDLTAKDKK